MLRKTLISLFLFVAASIQFSQSAAQPKLTMTSNVTTAKVGQPFTLRCKLENAIPETKDYNIEFWYSVNGQLAVFHFYNSASKNDTAFTFQGNFNDRNQQHIASLVPLPHKADSGVYELVVVAKTNFTTSFYCVKPIWAINYNSNHLILAVINSHIAEPTTTAKPPQKEVQVTISTNVTEHYRLKEAFNLRCSIAHFEAKGKRYSMQYFNNRDGRFASFDVDASGKSFLSIGEDYKKFNAHLGAKSEFPTFELVITENINATLNYWCQLQVQGPTSETFKSAVWKPSGLYLSFTSVNTEPKTKSHIGRCTIHGFEKHTSVDYDVSFYTDLGDQSNRFLGSFAVRVNRTTEFSHELHLDHWTSIAANVAGQTSYPSFEIIVQTDVKVSARNTAWWCWLRIARPGQNEYRLLESNKQKMEE